MGVIVAAVFLLVFATALRIAVSLAFAFPLYWAWNESMVLFGLPALTWWTAFCLLVVVGILWPSAPAPSTSKK